MAFHLICVHPFEGYAKGQRIEDADEVARLSSDREHHFVRVAAPDPEPVTAAAAPDKSQTASALADQAAPIGAASRKAKE